MRARAGGPPPHHRATTAHLQALYPFVSDGGPGLDRPLIGRDLLGGAFHFDPWELYRLGVLTSPNVLVLGQLGRGKSSLIKCLAWRQWAMGRRSWIIDPKGEYGPLADACGATVLRLAPGGRVRLNPLALPGPGGVDGCEGRDRARTELVGSLLSCSLGRVLAPQERVALELAVRTASSEAVEPTLVRLIDLLLSPSGSAAQEVRARPEELAADGRVLALELRRMVHGDLSGMFDGPSTVDPAAGSGVVVLDVSSTFASPALPLVMTCATAWLQSVLASEGAGQRLVVIDEAWAILSDLATARWAQSTFKLSRALGVANVVVVHRVTDLRAAGDDGSSQQKLADGLLADAETRVVFGQSPAEAAATSRALGLTQAETEAVCRLPKGVALWRLGRRSFLVEHLVGTDEAALVDTDSAMVAGPSEDLGGRL